MPWLEQGQRFIDEQVVTRSRLNGQRSADYFAGGIVTGKTTRTDMATEVVANVRGNNRTEGLNDMRMGERGRRENTGPG
ncbi:hypothetical protein D9M71_486230 [compost metagenome]